MNIAYFDCFAGIAGDMTLGALLDCGVPLEALREGLASLPVDGWDIEAEAVLLGGIHAVKVRVTLDGHSDEDEAEQRAHAPAHHDGHAHGDEQHHHHGASHSHSHAHTHEHSHSHNDGHHHHDHGHSHDHDHEHDDEHHHHHSHHHGDHDHHHHHGRSMAEIRAIIEASSLSGRVKKMGLDIFSAIAVVEAELHHSTPDEIHFHEIGGVDSLIDICGAAWCLEYLGVDEVYCSALPHSTGYVDCAHGRMPVPAPATLKLLRGAPLFPTDNVGEMITPTGAGIVGTLARGFGPPPAFIPRHVGFGGGKKRWADRPNLLRVSIGEKVETSAREPAGTATALQSSPHTSKLKGLTWQNLSLLETNIDDMNPEFFNIVFERLFAAGALDVWLQPIQMKKNRPATQLSALCPAEAGDAVLTAILRETTTVGVRVREVQRASLQRQAASVATRYGEVRVKVVRWDEEGLERATPEYEDVAKLAKDSLVTAREVYQAALEAAPPANKAAGGCLKDVVL